MNKVNRLVLALCGLCISAFAQQEIRFFDGTVEFTSRGGAAATAQKGLYERIPADQTCGAAAIHSMQLTLQDQDQTTTENFVIEVRGNDPAGPTTGQPDLSAAGVIGSVTVTGFSFGTGIGAAVSIVTVTFPVGGLLLPASPPGVPGSDLYVGVNSPITPGWPADGLGMHISAAIAPNVGEQMRTTAIGYTGLAGNAGMGWDSNLTALTSALGSGNRAWNVGVRFIQDTLQPFADNAAVFTGLAGVGLNPNFGYTGIFPDLVRGDGLGLRLRSKAAPGSSAFIAFDFALTGPLAIPGIDGALCLNLLTLTLLPTPVLTGPPPAGAGWASEAIIGPFTGIASLAGLGDVFAQCFTVDVGTGAGAISTSARTNL
jgi:hypothetical protein